jgi:hypothetical protein
MVGAFFTLILCLMRVLFSYSLAALLLFGSCSQAQSEKSPHEPKGSSGKKHKKESLENRFTEAAVPGLKRLGQLEGVQESSGLALGQPGTYYTMGDQGNPPILYQVDGDGKLLKEVRLSATNEDWESITHSPDGTLFVADAGNNNNSRRDLTIYRVNPAQPDAVGQIHFTYPDQQEFPPKKKQRNFDCEASVWHDGQIYLFTRDRGSKAISKVYTVPDKPGTYTARRVASLSIPDEVTDASISPNGRQLVLMGSEQMFVLKGTSLSSLLKAKPRRIALPGAGQTEGVLFTDDQTLLISSEQGSLYQYKMP